MQVAVLDLSRNPRVYDERLNEVFRDADVTSVDKSEWKKYSALRLWRAARAVRKDLFLIAVDDLGAVQDEFLLQVLGAATAAKRSGLLEMSTGRVRYVSASKLLLVDAPLSVVNAVATALFALIFALMIFVLLVFVRFRSGRIREAYGRSPITTVAYLKSDLALNITAGGSIAHTRGVIGGFLSNGVGVRVISNEDAPWLKITGTDLAVLGRTNLFNLIRETERMANGLFLAARAKRLIAKFRPDAIYQRRCHFDVSGVLLSLFFRVPLIIEGNDSVVEGVYWERTRLKWLAGLVERLQFGACTRAVSISQPLFETYRRLGYDTAKIRVIFNGVDVDRFNTDEVLRFVADTRASIGAPRASMLIGFVGTFGQWHGISLLTQAILALTQERPDVYFVLVGDGELKAQCERQIREADALDRVHFAGLVKADKVPALLAACDALVSPHARSPDGRKFFGSPTKLFEYMAAARAIVASDLDQIGEVLEHEKSALLFEPDSLPEFLAALRRVCDDAQLRHRLGSEARRIVCEHYTWRANVAQVLGAINTQIVVEQ